MNRRPTQHLCFQLGARYHQIGPDAQATFTLRINLLYPSPRRARPTEEAAEDGDRRSQSLLGRLLGRH